MTCGEAAVKARVTTPQDVRMPRLDESTTMFRIQRRDRTTLHSLLARALGALALIEKPLTALRMSLAAPEPTSASSGPVVERSLATRDSLT